MSKQINDGGPAFPLQAHGDEARSRYYMTQQGMTLRDYFAASEVISHADYMCSQASIALAGPKPEGNWSSNPVEWLKWEAKWRAELRFIRADAMLKARETKP